MHHTISPRRQLFAPSYAKSSTLLRLPLELLSLIVADIAFSSHTQNHPTPSLTLHPRTPSRAATHDLISLSLTHPTFAVLCAPILLRHFTLTASSHKTTWNTLTRLARIIKSVPGIERVVRSVKWVLEEPVGLSPGEGSQMVEPLTRLPQLESLHIHCGHAGATLLETPSHIAEMQDSETDEPEWKRHYFPDFASEALLSSAGEGAVEGPDTAPVLNFHSLFTAYITHPRHPCVLTNITLSNITSLPLLPILRLPSLVSLTLERCSALIEVDVKSLDYNMFIEGNTPSDSNDHEDKCTPATISLINLENFTAIDVSISITSKVVDNTNPDNLPSLPWFLRDVETMHLEDFECGEAGGSTQMTLNTGSPFSYRRLTKLTCVGSIDFHPLAGTGSPTAPFPALRHFTLEQSTYPSDHLCELYEYFENLEVFQIGHTSNQRLSPHAPLHHASLSSFLSSTASRKLKHIIIRRYEDAHAASDTLVELHDAFQGIITPMMNLGSGTHSPINLDAITLDITLTSSTVRDITHLEDELRRLGVVLHSFESVDLRVGVLWVPIAKPRCPRVDQRNEGSEEQRDGGEPGKGKGNVWGGCRWGDRDIAEQGGSWGWGSVGDSGWGSTGEYGWGSGDSGWAETEGSSSLWMKDFESPPSIPWSSLPSSPSSSSSSLFNPPVDPPEWFENPTDEELRALIERPLREGVGVGRSGVSVSVEMSRREWF